MALLANFGVSWPVANAIGFALSAQVHFGLSSTFTWGDRRRSVAGSGWARWTSFNATVLLGLTINTAAFTASHRVVGVLPATVAGVAVGTAVTYLICNYLIFRSQQAATPTSPATTPTYTVSAAGREEVPE
jgi:putative flippase GtrA